MGMKMPDAAVAQIMLWIWVFIVIVALVLFALWRRWRRVHPPPKREQPASYSQSLSKRLGAARQERKAKTRRGPHRAGDPRTDGGSPVDHPPR